MRNFAEWPDPLKVSELAALLRCGRNAAYQLVNSGTIRSVRIGRSIRIPIEAVADFLQEGGDAVPMDDASLTDAPNRQEGSVTDGG